MDGDVLDRALPALTAALLVLERAAKDLSGLGPTRHRLGWYYPVELVNKALLTGFHKAHGHWPGTSGPNSNVPLPPDLIAVSSADGVPFRRIVELSYEAAGAGSGSRERPIKEFITHLSRWAKGSDAR